MLIEKIQEMVSLAQTIKRKVTEDNFYQHQIEILSLLQLLEKLDLEEQYYLEKYKAPKALITECATIKKLAEQAKLKIKFKNYIPGNISTILNKIIELEQLIQVRIEPIISTFNIKRILKFTPAEVKSKGFIFRGISKDDYNLLLNNKSLFAPSPESKLSLAEHILNSAGLQTPFISFTTDFNSAKRFGIVIVVEVNKLKGHLYTPDEIESILKREAKQFWTLQLRLQRKNNEYVLGPSKLHIAEIPSDSVINLHRKLAAA